jgi:hypothetical protein
METIDFISHVTRTPILTSQLQSSVQGRDLGNIDPQCDYLPRDHNENPGPEDIYDWVSCSSVAPHVVHYVTPVLDESNSDGYLFLFLVLL